MTQTLIWFRNNAGDWNGDPSADPTTQIGGVDISVITGPYYPAGSQSTGFGQNFVQVFNFGASSFGETPPSSATSWGAATTLNPADSSSGVTLSDGNLGMAVGPEDTGGSRATTSSASQWGLRYFEAIMLTGDQTYSIGVANASADLEGNAVNPNWAVLTNDGGITVNGTLVASIGPISESPWVMSCAINILPPPPGTPIDLAISDPTLTALTGTWTAASGAPADSYTLQYRLHPAGSWTQITGITGTTQTVTGLIPATEYDFEVEAINAGGSSGFSSPASGTTLSPPVIDVSGPLYVAPGDTAMVFDNILSASAGMTPASSVAFTVVGGPSDGQLLINDPEPSDTWVPATAFTQGDINNGYLAYANIGANIGADAITFSMTANLASPILTTLDVKVLSGVIINQGTPAGVADLFVVPPDDEPGIVSEPAEVFPVPGGID